MVGGGAQGGVDRIADGQLYGLVGLVHGFVHHRERDVLGGIAGSEGQRARSQGVVHASLHGASAGHGVIHGHRLAGRGVQRDFDVNGGGGLGPAVGGGGESHAGRIVVVIDGVRVSGTTSQGTVAGTAQGDQHRLGGLVQGIVRYGNGDVLCRFARVVRQGARGQGVVGTASGGRTAGHGVIHGHRLARRRVEGNRQQHRRGGLGPV